MSYVKSTFQVKNILHTIRVTLEIVKSKQIAASRKELFREKRNTRVLYFIVRMFIVGYFETLLCETSSNCIKQNETFVFDRQQFICVSQFPYFNGNEYFETSHLR